MKVVIASATPHEVQPIQERLDPLYMGESARLNVQFVTTGVGMLASAFSLAKTMLEQKPDLVIQAGIAGSFTPHLALTQVVAVQNEILGDTGVEEDGTFKDLFDIGLQEPSAFPFHQRRLGNPWLDKLNISSLEKVDAITINEVSTNRSRIDELQSKYAIALESMEGAALHYVGLQTNIPFIQIRAISNMVGERDKRSWQMHKAIDNLCIIVLQYIDKLYNLR